MLRHLPNMLSGLRLAAAPATAGLLTTGHFDAALGLFAFAGVSDAADGFLAKRFGFTTRLGRILDPAADKALLLAAFVTLTLLGDVPHWLMLLVLLREALLLAGIFVAVRAQAPLVLKPLWIGKIATGLQILYIVVHLSGLAFGLTLGGFEPAAAFMVAGITIVSGLSYLGVWFRAMRARAGQDATLDLGLDLGLDPGSDRFGDRPGDRFGGGS